MVRLAVIAATAVLVNVSPAAGTVYTMEAAGPSGLTECTVTTVNEPHPESNSLFYSSTIRCKGPGTPLAYAWIQSKLYNSEAQEIDHDDPDECTWPARPDCGQYPLTSANQRFGLDKPREFLHRTQIKLLLGGADDPWVYAEPPLVCEPAIVANLGQGVECNLWEGDTLTDPPLG